MRQIVPVVVVTCMLAAGAAARADTITTFDVNATYTIPSTGTINGTLTLDVTGGTVSSVDIDVSGVAACSRKRVRVRGGDCLFVMPW